MALIISSDASIFISKRWRRILTTNLLVCFIIGRYSLAKMSKWDNTISRRRIICLQKQNTHILLMYFCRERICTYGVRYVDKYEEETEFGGTSTVRDHRY